MDFSLYKDRLSDYLSAIGLPQMEGRNIKCILPSHSGENRKDTAKIYNNGYTCFHCDFNGDVYDVCGELQGIADRAGQFKEVERVIGGGSGFVKIEGVLGAKKPSKPEQKRCKKAEEELTQYMRILKNSHQTEILEFAKHRGYGEDFAALFGYWPGRKQAIRDKGIQILKDAIIPYKPWDPPGCVVKLKDGWKLFYVVEDKEPGKYKTAKMASIGSKTFPFPTFDQKTKKITLVEAEISALACILNGIPTLATGGTNGVSKKSVEVLKEYDEITICLDGDNAGVKASEKMAERILDGGYEGVIKIAELTVEPWGNDPDDYIKNGHIENLKHTIATAGAYIPKSSEELFEESIEKNEVPFKFLGFSEHSHYFLDRKDMITKVPAGKMTSGQLLEIANLEFWKGIKVNKQGMPDWTFIFDMIIDFSIGAGPYKQSAIRGAGVWEDNNEIVASDGEVVICSQGRIPVRDYKSKSTYVRRAPIGIDSIENKSSTEDFKYLKWMTETLSFESKQEGQLLFGWIIASIFLSTIRWRPIVYMKGPSQVGKSWVMENIVREILDEIAICPKKSSTVIGIMQAPGYDSRMITIDEFENSNDKKTQELIKGLMITARDTTTKNKESRFIGTADQEGANTDFYSMFLFASIVESSEDDQDINRITPINFKRKKQENWASIEADVFSEMGSGLGERIRHNAIFHRDSIVKNIHFFQKIAGKKADLQRNGDNLGTLIAGWYHLEHPGKIATEEDAMEYVKQFDFSEQNSRGSGEMIKYIMSSIYSAKIRYEEEEVVALSNNDYDTRVKTRERTVYDILQHLKKLSERDVVKPGHHLNKALMSYGLRYGTKKNPGLLAIAQGHESVKKMLPRDFSYRNNFSDYLRNHKDFVEKEKSVKFLGTVHQVLIFKVDLGDEDYMDISEEETVVENDLFTAPSVYKDDIPF